MIILNIRRVKGRSEKYVGEILQGKYSLHGRISVLTEEPSVFQEIMKIKEPI